MENLVNISGLEVCYDGEEVLSGIDWQIQRNQNWRVCGASGSGKTTLLKAVAGIAKASGKISFNFDAKSPLAASAYYVDNWYRFESVDGDKNFYYQQRYNKQEQNDTLTVFAEMERFGRDRNLDILRVEPLLEKFGFEHCRQTQLIELSSGEHKKLQLVCALWLKPQLLLLDDPYTGLDFASRKILNDILDAEAADGLTYIIATNDDDLPKSVSRYAVMENGSFRECSSSERKFAPDSIELKPVPYFLQKAPMAEGLNIVDMKNVSVRYGEKTVLSNITWRVDAGQKWLLKGRNGSGKSTLLSLLVGDHPQAYANDISLFGRRRGSGESIWDIKEKIGIISPELHWYFDQNATVWNSVASGLKDTIGWFLDVSYEEGRQIESVLDFFGLLDVRDRYLNTLPLGRQRLALLARTIVKNPPLLVLDEPCQGLDGAQTEIFNSVLDALSAFGKTIIYVGHYESRLPKCLTHMLELEKGKTVYNGKI